MNQATSFIQQQQQQQQQRPLLQLRSAAAQPAIAMPQCRMALSSSVVSEQ
jgi:hypothetical protein